MRFFSTLILSAIILSVFSCTADQSAEVPKNTNHIFAKFYVRYLQTEKELKAEVSFKEGDTLSSARSIVFNDVTFENNPMEAQNLGKTYGIRYGFRKAGPYSKEYQFNYSDDQSGVLSHSVNMEPLTDFSIKDGAINKNSGTTIVWKGKPLTKHQGMILLFTDEQKKAFPVEIKGPTTKSEIELTANQLAGLKVGPGELMVIKKQLTSATEHNFTKISEMEFYSDNLVIEVVE